MSEENVETVRRAYAALEDGGVEAVIEVLDPEIVWEDLDALPGAATYRGHDGFREAFRRFYEAWGDLSFTPEEFIDAGDVVVVAHRWRGAGKSSGTPVDTIVWNVVTLRDGKITRRRAFQDREEALAAAGIQS